MWRKEFSINSEDLCFARSKLRIERTSFMWPVTDFKGLTGDKTCKRVHPIPDKKPVMDYILRLNQNDGEEEVRVEIDVEGGRGYSIFGEISVLDAEGRIIDSTKIKSRLHLDQTNIQFPMLTTKSKLMADEYLCLPNETLLLRCALEIFIGVSVSRIEYCTFLPSLNTEDFLNAEKQNEVDEEEFTYCSGPCPLKQALLNLYKDGSFSDVTLKAGTESFNVHKNILSVRSPVFKAMFTGNTVEDSHWEFAFDLYRAADEYELMDLRERCSDVLKANLSASNVCDIMSLAGMYLDQSLKMAAQDFVLEQGAGFTSSEEWKMFEETNSDLDNVLFLQKIRNSVKTHQNIKL
ncbi:speckle-type POZ protein [Caerostris extrusa]|uniref:Speckle-type POZ protein n=1 Tax=Caerostris extrusa TaxID=172846 RepID=A0AAV4MDF8_CAEEX|nr:speckle-type POZ protein [Caerostris extrusa]